MISGKKTKERHETTQYCSTLYLILISCLKEHNFSGHLSDFFEIFLEGKVEYGPFFEFERRYKAELGGEDRVDHIFHTSFEKLKRHPCREMKALGDFLGIERSEEFYAEVVDKTSIEKVKAVRDQEYKCVCLCVCVLGV